MSVDNHEVAVPGESGHELEQEDMRIDQPRVPSPMDNHEVPAPGEPAMSTAIEPATAHAAVNKSVANAWATVWTEWRAQREGVTLTSDEEDANSSCKIFDEEQPGLIMPEDDEDEDSDDEHDYQSVDDQVEVEWEKEWAEMGVLYVVIFQVRVLRLTIINGSERTYRGRPHLSSCVYI